MVLPNFAPQVQGQSLPFPVRLSVTKLSLLPQLESVLNIILSIPSFSPRSNPQIEDSELGVKRQSQDPVKKGNQKVVARLGAEEPREKSSVLKKGSGST